MRARFWSWLTTVLVAVGSGAIGFLGSDQLGLSGPWPIIIGVGSLLFTGVYLGMYLVGNEPITRREHDEDSAP